MPTTTATHYLLAYVDGEGRVLDHRALDWAPGPPPSFWAVRLRRFWPANRPGEANNPWRRASAVGRDRGAVCLHVGPLLHGPLDLDATGIRLFDVSVRRAAGDCFPVVNIDSLLPVKVRGEDGLLIQADLVDVSLFMRAGSLAAEAGRIIERRHPPHSELSVALTDTVALFSNVTGAILNALWSGILRPSGIDARAWDPAKAQFHLYGPSLDRKPQARPGTYLVAGLWEPLDADELRYDPTLGLCYCGERLRRVPANVLEFELIALTRP